MTQRSENTETPVVNPADLRTVLMALQEKRALKSSPEAVAELLRSLQPSLSPGADVQAVWTRTLIPGLLNHIMPGWMERTDMNKIIGLAAKFPMKFVDVGVEVSEPLFDVQAFVRQIAAR
jgi:hypothetical protein